MTRAERLAFLIGRPWNWRSHNCWVFACHVEQELFGRSLPAVEVPADPSWRWMMAEIDQHGERANWSEVADGPVLTAADGALVLMGRFRHPGHVGVWLKPEQRVIHCDRDNGVCFETVLALRQQGWRQLRFFEPKVV
jgi:hypothetical protein